MKKLIALTCLAQLGILMIGTHCAPTSSSAVEAQSIGEPFFLRIGESASVEGADLSLTFSAVTQDSRCPEDVDCVVAGEAVVVIDALSSGEHTELTFKVPPRGSDAQELEDLTITIVELSPEPESGKRMEPSNYVAKLLVNAD